MNTDKIYAESIANQYAPKDTSKVVALRKLDRKAKKPSEIFAYTFGILSTSMAAKSRAMASRFSFSSFRPMPLPRRNLAQRSSVHCLTRRSVAPCSFS